MTKTQAENERQDALSKSILKLTAALRDAIETRVETPSEKQSRNEVILKCLDALANARTAFTTANA